MFKLRIPKSDIIAHFKYACRKYLWLYPFAPLIIYGEQAWHCADAERQIAFRDKSALYGRPPEERDALPSWPGLRP